MGAGCLGAPAIGLLWGHPTPSPRSLAQLPPGSCWPLVFGPWSWHLARYRVQQGKQGWSAWLGNPEPRTSSPGQWLSPPPPKPGSPGSLAWGPGSGSSAVGSASPLQTQSNLTLGLWDAPDTTRSLLGPGLLGTTGPGHEEGALLAGVSRPLESRVLQNPPLLSS